MRNRLKGITLIETMLYIGLFSIIILIVLNFMLSTQESTLKNNRRGTVYKSAEFIIQHINYSFDKALSIDNNSIFGSNLGTLQLNFADGDKQYYVADNTLYYDGTPITPTNILVNEFSLEPVYDNSGTLLGSRINILLISKEDSKITDTINLLSILR